jgi:isopenicillin N synthase-like dioxygenase
MLEASPSVRETVERLLRHDFATIKAPILGPLEEVFRSAVDFFRSSLEEKLASRLRLDTGYRPYGVEYSESAAHPDEVESFSVSRRVSGVEAALQSASAVALYRAMLQLFDLMVPIVEQLTDALASQLTGDRENQAVRGAVARWSILQLNYSRPALTQSEFINDLHEDGCLMTLMSVTSRGLELQRSDGTFLPVGPFSNELLLLPGEILWLLSGGTIRPTYHRVRTIPDITERMSLLFFADIDPALCKPWISNDVNKGVNIGDLVLRNSARYGLDEWETK